MHDNFDSEKFTIINGLGISLTFFRQIYYDVKINCKSTRILFVISAVSTYLVYIHYTAYLTASSTYGKKDQIESFADVLSGGYKVAVWENSAQHDDLRHAKQGTAMNEVYHRTMKNSPDAFLEPTTEVQKIFSKRKTLIYWTDFYMKAQNKDLNVFNIQGILYLN